MAQTNPHGNKKKTGNKVLYTSASFAAVLPPCEFVYVTNYAIATPNKNSIGKNLVVTNSWCLSFLGSHVKNVKKW